jgi:ribosomal protein L16 Arg81 hydroxylase
MQQLNDLNDAVEQIKADISDLLNAEELDGAQLEEKVVTLERLLTVVSVDAIAQDDYRLFLTENLHWLTSLISKLTEDKASIAASILEISKRQQAEKSYGAHKITR